VALAACVILILFPASLLSPSFQLSLAAVAAIIAMVEASEAWRQRTLTDRHIVLRALFYLAGTAAVALIASVATLPFTYYHFQQVNLYGVIANMLADPLAAFWLMPLAVLVLLLAPFGLAEYPLLLLGQGVEWLMAIAASVAALPGADWIVPAMPYVAFVFILVGALWLLVWQGRVRWLGIMIIFLATPFIALHQKPRALIDGQGKFAVIASGNEYILMANGKVRPDNFVLQQWQRYLGIRTLLPAAESPNCDSVGCFDGTIDYVRGADALPELCDSNKPYIIISANAPYRCKALVDAFNLRRNGAHSVTADGEIENVDDAVGNWPWRN
jgi:competence protein ComEC